MRIVGHGFSGGDTANVDRLVLDKPPPAEVHGLRVWLALRHEAGDVDETTIAIEIAGPDGQLIIGKKNEFDAADGKMAFDFDFVVTHLGPHPITAVIDGVRHHLADLPVTMA